MTEYPITVTYFNVSTGESYDAGFETHRGAKMFMDTLEDQNIEYRVEGI